MISWYATVICPLSPLGRSLIIAAIVVLALIHIRLLYMLEDWMRRPDLHVSRPFAMITLMAAHIDAAIVGGFAFFHAAAESRCPAAGGALRLGLPLASAGAMVLFAWVLFLPHISRRTDG